MIIDSFDNLSKPIVTLQDAFGDRKHIIDKCIILFSKVIFDWIIDNKECKVIGYYGGCNGRFNIYSFKENGEDIGFYLSDLGSTMASQDMLEVAWQSGASKFIMFGSCGVIDRNAAGKFIVPTYSYRDEGMSYHYMEPSDYVFVKNSDFIEKVFIDLGLPYAKGKNWTTDAVLMETENNAKKRLNDGCISVDMELSGVQAVCDYSGFELYDFMQAGDVVVPDGYDLAHIHGANHDLIKLDIALEIAKRI